VKSEIVSNFIARRIASMAIAVALAAAGSGCAAGALGIVTTAVPMVAAGSAQVISAGAASRESGGTGASSKENADQCDQLLRVAPGVEEVRKNKDGLIDSRQWKITQDSGGPAWMCVRTKDAPGDGWQPRPDIAELLFNPPLYQMLEPDKPQYLAYAPNSVINLSDSEQFDSMTGAFGAGVGTFKWHDRSYSFVLVKELPCFKPPKEK